ncbi:MAG: hypothetical protein ACYC43_05630 [Burkholderiales bacterium]
MMKRANALSCLLPFIYILPVFALSGCLIGSSATTPNTPSTTTTPTTPTATPGSTPSTPSAGVTTRFITGGNTGFANPGFLAIDGKQNVWVSNMGLFASPGATELTQSSGYDPASAINIINTNPYYDFFNARDIAIDKSNNIWIVTNESQYLTMAMSNNLIELTAASGYALAGALVIPLNNFGKANGIAIDGAGNIWVSIFDGLGLMGGIVEFPYSLISASGASGISIATAANFLTTPNNLPNPTGSIHGPIKLAADHAGNIWIANYYGNSVTELPASAISATGATGASISAASLTISGGNANFNAPTGIAVDQTGNVWVANIGTNSVIELPYSALSASGATVSSIAANSVSISAGTTGFSGPSGVAVDGAGNIWIANNNNAGSVTELTNSSGYSAGSAVNMPVGSPSVNNTPTDIAVDGSGNVWITNSGIYLGPGGGYKFVNYSGGGVTELIGVAAPLTTLPVLPGVAGP